ncbi:MAG TPA: hypothetical protein VM032_14840, partial [Vicinamibacterales bacterium]|nr:hypothetical protein [Vicinamibacterales bacterium]
GCCALPLTAHTTLTNPATTALISHFAIVTSERKASRDRAAPYKKNGPAARPTAVRAGPLGGPVHDLRLFD